MAKIFQIDSTSETVQLGKDGKGELTFTVTNLGSPIGGRAVLNSIGETDEAWLSVVGRDERDLKTNKPEEFVVRIEMPEDAPEEKFGFRFDMISVLNPDDDYSQSPEIEILRQPPKRKRPWWLYLLLGLFLLLVLGGIVWLLVGDRESAGDDTGDGAAVSSEQSGSEGAAAAGGAGAGGARKVPNFMGLGQAEALREAEAVGLALEPADWSEVEGLEVAGQSPRPGETLAAGGVVTLELTTRVPELVGLQESEAVRLLESSGLAKGEVAHRRGEELSGQVVEQGITASAETGAGTAIDLTVSLGGCYWTPVFGARYGPGSCRSGSAVAGLSCIESKCSYWQINCCPYRPFSDPKAESALSPWFPSRTAASAPERSSAFLGGLEVGGQGQKRVRYLQSPSLEKRSECRRLNGSPNQPVICNSDEFVASFSCDSSLCNRWSASCCGAKVASQD